MTEQPQPLEDEPQPLEALPVEPLPERLTTVQPRVPRHPARVTFDRLVDDLEKYREQLTPREIAAAEMVLRGLDAVADGLR